ncbi:stonin-1/2 [Paragonimus westermani]|uniref:Stonin-1/2 n=1 Tax=Paragonimus westermani TaxID=34504 RepID=A0A5J4NSN0_9TREM|nr:stonin-1/2 [Paragonimus westermani]
MRKLYYTPNFLFTIGPLPSDPDPNFPFRKHLEKSVVPNPKKAIQRIIRGETRAERRQRKEQEELNRLLRSSEPTKSQPTASKSTEWEEFHQLTAQIEHTVQETASKVKTITPVQASSHPLEEEDTDEPESWAKFKTVFGTQAEPVAVFVEDPWEEAESHDSTTVLFDLTEEETQAAQQDQEVWPESIDPELDINIICTVQDQSADLFNKLQTEGERELQTEDSTDIFRQELLENIDNFLGINGPPNQLIQSEPISSDPLEVLERLRPEPEVNPLEELGFNLQPSSMGTKLVPESDLSSEFEDGITQVHRQESQGDSSQVSSKDVLKDDEAASIKDESGFEILESAEPEPIDITSDDQQPESHQGIQLPDVDEQDPSDLDDATTLDDVLWGGFGEVHASQTDQHMAISSPFGADDFSKLHAPAGISQIPLAYQVDTTTVRPRHKPVRQETLSGNNPFRKRSGTDQTLGDELAKAAAGIQLVGSHRGSHKRRDSFESSDGSTTDDKVGVDVGDNTEDALTPNNFPATDGALFKPADSGFDPLQTIYPESDNESVTSGEQESADKEAPFAISINERLPDSTENGETVPTLKAPPRPAVVVHITPGSMVEPEFNEQETQKIIVKQETPVGWVDFASESVEFADGVDRPVVAVDAAFEVDWAATVTRSEPAEPEPPRPDTPDPELDNPFHSPAEDGVYYRLWLRFPEKKTRVKQVSKYTTDRYWREIAVRFSEEHNRKVINLHEIDEKSDEPSPEPYRSIRIEPYMQLSREKLQQYDKYGKLHVFKLNHVSYRELVGIRPEKFTIKNLQHLVTHKPKQNLAVDHLPVYTEILKFGSLDQQRIRSLMPVFEDALMRIATHKDATLSYTREEVCCYVVDEYQAKVSSNGSIQEQKARTRILCTAFVNGGPHIVLGLNDKWRYGREVVRRSDILPVMHDEWISIRKPEFHSCVELEAYEKDHMLKFYPLDGCRFELIRFRVSLRGHRELPMQTKTTYAIDGRRVSMRCELLVPGFFSASHRKGAVPCENVEIHIPVPEDWIYHFRVEKHHKYGSVHSTLRKPGRIKGLERITQMAQSLLPPSILEASIGLAKYEHLYKAVVWRIGRIPDKHEASLRPHLLTCKLTLAQHDTVPEWETLVPDCQIEYTMPSSTVSGATVRSISVEHTGVAEKFVKYTAKYKYTVGIDYQLGTRKEPALKCMLEEPDTAADGIVPDSAVWNEIQNSHSADETSNQEEIHNEEVADLLGLGDE